MKKGDKIVAIDACVSGATGNPALTVGKEYEVLSVKISVFTISDDHGEINHFRFAELETYFQSITPEALEELGFKQDSFGDWLLRVNGLEIEIRKDFSIRLHTITLPNCRTLTDLKHLIRLLGV